MVRYFEFNNNYLPGLASAPRLVGPAANSLERVNSWNGLATDH